MMATLVGGGTAIRSKPRGGAERRAEPRFSINEPAMLHALRPAGDEVSVQIVDVSENGLGLRSAEPLPTGALVHIRIRGTIVAMGEVRYSAGGGDGFYSGVRVQFSGDCRSSWESD